MRKKEINRKTNITQKHLKKDPNLKSFFYDQIVFFARNDDDFGRFCLQNVSVRQIQENRIFYVIKIHVKLVFGVTVWVETILLIFERVAQHLTDVCVVAKNRHRHEMNADDFR